VRIGALTRLGAVTRDGAGEAVQGLVLGLRGANARAVVEGVRAKLAELAPSLPEGVTVRPFYDRGELVARAVGTVRRALVEAIVLVGLVLLLFLGDLRAAVTAALVVPFAVCATFLAMRAAGMSANLMSLGGLAIAIGLLVDGAVVVVENVVATLRQPEAERLPAAHVVYRAAREVALPVASGTAIIVIVFLPLLTLEGLEGKLFIPVALTIVFALAASLALALTAIPVLASLLLGRGGATCPALRDYVGQRGLSGRIVLTGRVSHDEVPGLLAAMDMAILPSAGDYTSPVKLFEFMACGVAPVAPDFAPIREVLQQGETGWMFKAGDLDAAIDAVLERSRDPATLARVGGNARRRVAERHQWRNNITQLVDFHQRLQGGDWI